MVAADYDAQSAVERELVLRLASVLWRLRRATNIETALFESVTGRSAPAKPELRSESKAVLEIASLSEQSRLVLIEGRDQQTSKLSKSESPGTNRSSTNMNKTLAMVFLRLADLQAFPLDRLSRYEHLFWRQARQLVFTLEAFRRRRSPPRRSSFPPSFRRWERNEEFT